jgi:hypothetical protein
VAGAGDDDASDAGTEDPLPENLARWETIRAAQLRRAELAELHEGWRT